MDEFVTAVARVRDRLVQTLDPQTVNEAALAYVQDGERLAEAEAVSPCVLRFVAAEINPPADGRPVGRFAGVTVARRSAPSCAKHATGRASSFLYAGWSPAQWPMATFQWSRRRRWLGP